MGLADAQPHPTQPRCAMFEKSEIDSELHARLKAAGLDPLDPKVKAINAIVSVYYAEKTSKVLQQVQDVLNRITR
jgi:hypothetical protein